MEGKEEGKERKEVERVRFIGRSTARPFIRMEEWKDGRTKRNTHYAIRITFYVSRFTLHEPHNCKWYECT
ncbi:hypothetical protein HYR99_12400 [Candidatus Poribacteria bacterium]|nr:hypothetical protein [Candidatus Poribacteria bacterium]